MNRDITITEVLFDLLVQFCSYKGKFEHAFMSAEEEAFEALGIKYGDRIADVAARLGIEYDSSFDDEDFI